ncbi:MAG: nuclear transport factor 2 family protein [Parvularculaceae bacterium]
MSFTVGAAALAVGAASAETQRCARGTDVRTIEAVTPGVVGAACDLRYARGGAVTVPYRADNSAGYCAEQAANLVASLVGAGFACTPVEGAGAESPLAQVHATAAPAATPPAAPAPVTKAQPLDPPEPNAELADAEASNVGGPAEDAEIDRQARITSPSVDDGELEGGSTSLSPEYAPLVPAAPSGVASRGPIALAPTTASADAPVARAPQSSVGRLVGAAPDAAPLSLKTAEPAQEERIAPALAAKAAAAAPSLVAGGSTAGAAASVSTSTLAPAAQRPSRDVIRNVLTAQAAAWNEGDLDAFMRGYWNNPDLRFVSGTSVSKGWNQTLKRYRERYGDGAALGRLSFDGLDVQMVTDDVAVVVGRFALARSEAVETGAFTLVMRRFDGLWRIVHDHSVGDPPPKSN